MSQVSSRIRVANFAPARVIDRRRIVLIPGVLYVEFPAIGEQLAIPRVACGHHAVEQVSTDATRLDDVLGRAHAHQIPGAIFRHFWRYMRNYLEHSSLFLTNRQPS